MIEPPKSRRHDRAVARRARRAGGFSLIELMITCAILAILAAIAVPSYMDSVWKGKRGEAKAAIMKALQAEERYYTQNNTYVAYTTTAPSGAFPIFSADTLANSRYTVTAQAGPVTATDPSGNPVTLCPAPNNAVGQCVVVTATVVGNPDPNCGAALYADSIGNKGFATATKPDARLCWG